MRLSTLLVQLVFAIFFITLFDIMLKESASAKETSEDVEFTTKPYAEPKSSQSNTFRAVDYQVFKLLDTNPVSYNMQENRYNLAKVVQWMEYKTYETSFVHYGIALDDVALLDLPYEKNQPTHADVISYIAGTYFPGPKSYLEVGVSAGKTLYQMVNAFSNSLLFGFEIENINPALEEFLALKDVKSSWPTKSSSPRKAPSTSTSYKFPDSNNEVHYVAADVFDVDSWQSLHGRRFDVIFLDGPPETMYAETNMLLSMNIISYERFMIWYGGIDGENATSTFFENINNLKEKRCRWLNKDNVALVEARGTLDDVRNYGIISTLNITKIIRDDLVA